MPKDNLFDGTNIATASTSDILLEANPGAAKALYVTDIIISNTSATATEVTIKSGSTARLYYPAPPDSGAVHSLHSPLRIGTNEACNFACADSVSSVRVSILGYIAP